MNSHRFPKYTRRPKYIPINTEEENAKVILSNLYTNRSITNLYMNNVREAVMDATQALYTSIENKNAFIARGNACVKMENFTSAYDDYIEALKLDPTSRYVFDLSSNTYQRIRQQELLDDIQTKTRSILDYPYFPYQPISPKTFDFQNFTVDDAIEVMNIVERFELLSPEITLEMMATMCEIMAPLPNVVNIPDVNEIFVVGDTHGQLQDVLNIFKKFGNPSAKRPYLFNGDYVDRGSQGLEILLILFAWKIADDKCIYINRGNHEAMAMNDLYGFSKECELKAGPDSFEFVTKVFEYLPIAHIINDKVFVVHGGISPNSDMTIESLQKINRVMQPPEDGPLNDVLWSDPADDNGATAVRGGAVLFDSTMTHEFLSKNNLELLIRSHQVVKEGYRIQHDGKCITVFSAPNYVGKVGNLGCVMKIIIEDGKDLKYELNTFDALPFPFDFEPMLYCDMERFRC